MHPPDTEAQEAAAWAAFLAQLAEQLAAQWPAMQERLGDRLPAFVELASQQALLRGLRRAASVARLANLWCVWGPAFHDRPGFEWAAEILAAAQRQREWPVLHRLLVRSQQELLHLPDARITPEALAAADARLLEAFARLGEHGALHPPEPPPLPRAACDLEAVELRLMEPAVEQHYVFAAGQWQRAPLPAPAPLRIDAANPAPRLAAVLAHAPGEKPVARVQLRSRAHALCDADAHPALDFGGTHGLWQWLGHETRAVSWPVASLAQALAAPGLAIAEETSPDIFKLELNVCGLRDEGEPMGSVATQLWAWPAAQWLMTLERQPAEPQPVLPGREPAARGATRVAVERDGQPQDGAPLRRAFEAGLDARTADALQTLLATLARVEGLSALRLDGQLALLAGRAACTWGWALGPQGFGARAFMRLLGALEMTACQSELHAEAELALHDARARLRLHASGSTPLAQTLRREAAEPLLTEVLLPAKATFRVPITAELVPLATDAGTLLQAGGPCTGALVGEAGLRPRLSGGSGWEWYAMLRLEPAALPLRIVDPVLGERQLTHPLWDAQVLLDWSAA